MTEIQNITVLGDGAWGTALARVAVANTHKVIMWGHDKDYLETMAAKKENVKFLPGVPLSPMLTFEADMTKAVADADIIISAIPTIYMRSSLEGKQGIIPAKSGIISVTKGIEQGTLLRPTEILRELLEHDNIGVLAGPSHAEEVARDYPTMVVVGADNPEFASKVQHALMSPMFRIYTGADPKGMEIAGALKNVMALTVGACTAMNLGDNLIAGLLTRGLAEMVRLGVALGADPQTFYGLGGFGDLIVTCFSEHSRNRRFGYEAMKTNSHKFALESHDYVAEGYFTSKSALDLARKHNVEMPIVEQVNKVFYEAKDPQKAIIELMSRKATTEK